MSPDSILPLMEADDNGSYSAIEFFDIRSFDMVRRFVQHVVDENAPTLLGSGDHSGPAIDWGAVEASVAGALTLEQAIGRAVVIADQMSRGLFGCAQVQDDPTSRPDAPSLAAEDPFFAFSMADVVPDFGDESRYRLRVARKVARIFGTPGR